MSEELKVITVNCPSGYKFPLQLDKMFYIPVAFLREALNKKFKYWSDSLPVTRLTVKALAKETTSRKEELKNLIEGLNYVLDSVESLGFDKVVDWYTIPVVDLKKSKVEKLIESIYNSSVYPTLPPLNVDPIIQMKESEVYELHKKVIDLEKLKAENERLNLLVEQSLIDQEIIDNKLNEIADLTAKLAENSQKMELKDKTIARLVNSVNRTAKELDLTKSIYKDIIKSLVKG